MNTMTLIAEIHGPRLWGGSVVPVAGVPTYGRARKQRPAVLTIGVFKTDNSTGVSEVECRHT